MEESGETQVPKRTDNRSDVTNNHDAVNQNAREVKDQKDQKSTPTPKLPDDTYHEVDKLLKVRRIGGQTQYLVKWKGNYQSSWEPDDYITENPQTRISYPKDEDGTETKKEKITVLQKLGCLASNIYWVSI